MLSDPVFLSRLQFAFVIAFHILLPAFTVGLASYIAVLEGLLLRDRARRCICGSSMFWIKIFAVSFGMGVVSGIVMPFQFGTNWSRYSERPRNVVGAAVGLRGPDRVLPRGGVPRHPAVRPQARAALGAFLRRGHGGGRHAVLVVLDPGRQQLDADAGRLRDRRRPLRPRRLARR